MELETRLMMGGLALFAVLQFLKPVRDLAEAFVRSRVARLLWWALLVGASVSLCILIFRNLAGQYFADHVEVNNVVNAWLHAVGEPLYQRLDDASIYSLPYGPLVFLAPELSMRILGPGITAAKIPFALAALAVLPVFAGALRYLLIPPSEAKPARGRRRGRPATRAAKPIPKPKPKPDRAALLVPALGILAALCGRMQMIWTRAEPLLMLSAALALFAAVLPRTRGAIIVMALALGLGCGAKIYMLAMLLPAVAILGQRHGIRAATLALVGGGTLTLLPFALPGVSLVEFVRLGAFEKAIHDVDYYSAAASQLFVTNFVAYLIFCVAICASPQRFVVRNWVTLAAMAVATITALHFGSLSGSWDYAIIPMIPAYLFVGAMALAEGVRPAARSLFLALAAAFLVRAGIYVEGSQRYIYDRLVEYSWIAEPIEEARVYMASRPGVPIGVGYAMESYYNEARLMGVFAGSRFYLDENLVTDFANAGRPLPPATLEAMRTCRNRAWLLPRNASEFQMFSGFNMNQKVFPPEFVQAFRESYHRTGVQMRYFDVWECNR